MNPISPSYYQFPDGHEVRHIAAHLTGFGAQAVQYVSRSCRLDGNNKGDPIENISKAIRFLEWERERLHALGEREHENRVHISAASPQEVLKNIDKRDGRLFSEEAHQVIMNSFTGGPKPVSGRYW